MKDTRLIPYRGAPRQTPLTALVNKANDSIPKIPSKTETITNISEIPQNPKTIPINALQSARYILDSFRNPEKPLVIEQSRVEFENSVKFKNVKKSVRDNYRALNGLFNDEGLISQLLLSYGPAFSKDEIIAIDKLKSVDVSDKVRLSFLVKAIVTKGENNPNFRKDPSMRALLSQLTNKVENGEHKNVEKLESESIVINEYSYDFDIDTYNIELLRAMKFILERFISKPNNDQLNTSQPKLN